MRKDVDMMMVEESEEEQSEQEEVKAKVLAKIKPNKKVAAKKQFKAIKK